MRYAQYYQESVTEPEKLIPACACDAIRPINGRYRVSRCLEDAATADIVKVKGYKAVQIFEGTKYTDSKALTGIVRFEDIII